MYILDECDNSEPKEMKWVEFVLLLFIKIIQISMLYQFKFTK